jgi:uncharacterized membrane protein
MRGSERHHSRFIARATVIAATYSTVTVGLSPISYGYFQVRVSEALTLLPMILGSAAVIGLFLGAFISNAFSPVGVVDVVFSSLATLLAAVLTWKANRGSVWLGAAYPVVCNTVIVGSYLSWFYQVPLIVSFGGVGAGEAIACYLLGVPLTKLLQKYIPKSIWNV